MCPGPPTTASMSAGEEAIAAQVVMMMMMMIMMMMIMIMIMIMMITELPASAASLSRILWSRYLASSSFSSGFRPEKIYISYAVI